MTVIECGMKRRRRTKGRICLVDYQKVGSGP